MLHIFSLGIFTECRCILNGLNYITNCTGITFQRAGANQHDYGHIEVIFINSQSETLPNTPSTASKRPSDEAFSKQ